MKRGKKVDFWFPLYADKWLWGSTRHELEHSERAIFTDLMALATKDDGYVRANETTPYPHPQLAGILCCSVELLESTIDKCIKFGKVEDKGNGIYYICNWREYSFSVRWIREVNKGNRVCSEKTEGASENPPDSGKPYCIVSSNIVSSNIELNKNLILDQKLVQLLIDLIQKNNPESAIIKRLMERGQDRWLQSCRLLREADKRTPEEIEGVIRFSQADEFWRGNILSMPKLREKWDQLWMKMNRSKFKAQDRMAGIKEWLEDKESGK